MKIKRINIKREEKVIIKNVSLDYSKKRFFIPTQQYYNGYYMEETVHDLTMKIEQRKKMNTIIKYHFEGCFDIKTKREDVMCTFKNTNISQFSGNL